MALVFTSIVEVVEILYMHPPTSPIAPTTLTVRENHPRGGLIHFSFGNMADREHHLDSIHLNLYSYISCFL